MYLQNFKMATKQGKIEIVMSKPQLRSLKQKALEDTENGMTSSDENVVSTNVLFCMPYFISKTYRRAVTGLNEKFY